LVYSEGSIRPDLGWHRCPPSQIHEFLKLILPVVAKVKCAHTLFYPSEHILTSGTRFPFDLKFIDGRGYLIPDSVNQFRVSKGSELLSINSEALSDIIDLLLPNLEAQGGNLGWKNAILENDFHNYYYYVIDQTDVFQIEYFDHVTRQTVMKRIPGREDQARMRYWGKWYPQEAGAPLKLKYFIEENTALITIKSFSKGRFKQYQQDFDKLIAQYFEEIRTRGVQNLIIDLRGNEGGKQSRKSLFLHRQGK
jgi:hypothetical protein